MRENVENKGRKVRSVVVFAIVEAAILVLFFAFMIGNFFVARGTTASAGACSIGNALSLRRKRSGR